MANLAETKSATSCVAKFTLTLEVMEVMTWRSVTDSILVLCYWYITVLLSRVVPLNTIK